MTYYSNKPPAYNIDREEYIGIGQISSKVYKDFAVPNRGGEKGKEPSGWSERYKVRLCSLNSKETPDDQLIDAIRRNDLPSGQGGLQIYMPLAPDTFVHIKKDKISKNYFIESVITNPLGKFEKNKEGEDKGGCAPKSGFSAGLAQYSIVPSSNIKDSDTVNLNGAGVDYSYSQSDDDFDKLKEKLPIPSACKPFDSNAINNALKNMKKDIEGLRNKLNGPNSALTDAENFLREAQSIVNGYANTVTGYVKWLIGLIKDLVVRGVNWALNKAKATAFLNQRFQLQDKKTKAIDLILCLFNKILDNLAGLVEQFLTSIVNRYINMATCAIEKFLTELVGQIIGQILAAVNGILNAVLGAISAIKGLIDSILDAITSLLDFLSCDAKAECAEVTEWSPLEGAPAPGLSLDIGRITSAAKSLISSATSIVDPNNFNFNLDINSMIVGANDACNVGPILCGPPKINFWGGGGGSGATGNAIIGAAGNILGIDIVSTGYGYANAPFVNIEDSCGRGRGATAVAVIGKVPYVPPSGAGSVTTDTPTGTGTGTEIIAGDGIAPNPGDLVDGIVDVIVIDNGINYLPQPDGSKGGDGRTWADRCQSIVRRVDGTWDYPYSPGESMDIKAGDFVQLAGENPYTASEDTLLTAPQCPDVGEVGSYVSSSVGTYPVTLELSGVQIIDPGFGYEDGDTIVITPDRGAVLTPQFGYNGQLTGIAIDNKGIGYITIPQIGIDSLNGYNAVIKPVFRVVKDTSIEALREKGVIPISVVDCVGKPL